jgi:hypothetical protein
VKGKKIQGKLGTDAMIKIKQVWLTIASIPSMCDKIDLRGIL